MTPEATTDFGELIKQKTAEQLAHVLLPKNTKPDKVRLIVRYRESSVEVDIQL